MGKIILKRLLQAIPMLIFISIISFFLIKFAPGDPVKAYVTPKMSHQQVENVRHNLGLDKPIIVQYFIWSKNVFKGNLGYSLRDYRPVTREISERLPATLELMSTSLILSLILGIIFGLLSAKYNNKTFDKIVSLLSYVGISLPSFWFAMILIVIFSLKLHWLPSIGMHTIGENSFIDVIKHGIMPCLVLSIQDTAIITRYVRSNSVEQMKEDYVKTAIAKGLSSEKVFFKHVLKNALLPVITILGMALPDLFAGAFITETVFGWPGMGRLGINAMFSFDYPIIMGITMFSSIMLIIGNLLADLLYELADPRIRMAR